MKSIVKFPLLALFCLFFAEATISPAAIAGKQGVTLPGVEVSDTFSNNDPTTPIATPTRITNGVNNTLTDIERSDSVPSTNGRDIPVTPDQIDRVVAAITNNTPNALQNLEQQIFSETGIRVDVSSLGASPTDLETAINSANELIGTLDSQQLAAAIESPTLMTLLDVLRGGNEALSDRNLNVLFAEGTNDLGLFKLSLGSDPVPQATPEVVTPVRREEAVSEPQPPEPIPTFQEPVRGLW